MSFLLNIKRTIKFRKIFFFFWLLLLFKFNLAQNCPINITPSSTNICSGNSVTLVANGANTYTWSNGSTNDTIVINPVATTTVTVTGVCGPGSQGTASVVITVNPFPSANFNSSPVQPCANTPMVFTNTSTGTGLTYSWNFGDPATGPLNTSTQTNPSHQFTSAVGNSTQTYNVTLIATSTAGCTNSIAKQVTVKQRPDASLLDVSFPQNAPAGEFTACYGSVFDLEVMINTSTAPIITNYDISWGDGATNFNSANPNLSNSIYHQYTTLGYFNILLTVTNGIGCTDTSKHVAYNGIQPQIQIFPAGSPPVSVVNVCTPATIPFQLSGYQANSAGTIYVITSNTGLPPVVYNQTQILNLPGGIYNHLFSNSSCGSFGGSVPNSFYIEIKAENQCFQALNKVEPITTASKPDAKITISPDTIACINSNIVIKNTSNYGVLVNNQFVCDTLNKFKWMISPSTGWGPPTGSNNVISPGNQLGSSTPTNNPSTWGSKNLNISFNAPGQYTVTLVISNNCSSDTATQIICIESPPSPSFNITQSGCAPFIPSITNTSTFQYLCKPIAAKWTITKLSNTCTADSSQDFRFISSTSDTSYLPSIRFNNQGVYKVQLALTNKCSTFNFIDTILVKRKPKINIASISGSCGPTTVSPTATVTNCANNTLTYNWSFSGGTPATSTQATPGSVSFTTVGIHTVTLTAGNECGTTTEDTTFAISQPPVISAGNNGVVCAGTTINLSGSAINGTAPYDFAWTSNPTGFTSNNQITTATPTISTTYSLQVTDAGNCVSNTTVTYTVNPQPNFNLTDTSLCIGQSISLNASGANNYSWNTGSTSPSIVVSPTVTTNYVLSGTITPSNCTRIDTITVTVKQLPIVDAGTYPTFCNQPIPTPLNNATPTGGTWSGPGITSSGIFTPNATGNFTFTYDYTDTITGCSNSDNVTIAVGNAQNANAGTGFKVCKNSPLITLSGFTPPGGTWSGVGISLDTFNPDTAGNFILTYAFGSGSCLVTDTIQVTVFPLPPLTVNSPTICDGQTVTLNASGADQYSWNTGSNSASIVVTPTVTTNYTVTGTETTHGCTVSVTSTVTVNTLPVVNAGQDILVCNQPFNNVLTGYSPPGGIWTGPGVSSTGTYQPTSNGIDTLIYTFGDQTTGCATSDSIIVTIISPTTVNAGTGFSICVNANNDTLSGYSPAIGCTWSGSGVSFDGIFNPSAAGVGTQTLTLSVGTGSCLSIDTIQIQVLALPPLSVNSPAVCSGQPATIQALGADQYSWDTGSNSSSIIVNPANTSTFTVTGTNTLTGCSTTAVSTVTINNLPVVNFSNDSIGCKNNNITFTNSTTGATNYNWNFGDGGTSASTSPSHPFSSTGTFTVTLVASSGVGCVDSISDIIEITEPPVAIFTSTPDSGCSPLEVYFNNNSTGGFVNYNWNFGNGTSSVLTSPDTITFNQGQFDTTYVVSLSATNICGTSISTDTILVKPKPIINFGTNVNSGCSPLPIFFSNTSTGSASQYIWNFGDGTANSNLFLPSSHTFFTGTNDTTYTITLIGINYCGSDTSTTSILVHPNTVNSFFNTSVTSGCGPLAVTFTNFSTGGTIFSWEFGDGNLFGAQNSVTHIYNNPGTYVCSLMVNNGCSYDTSTINITVNPGPNLSFTMVTTPACAENPVQFTNASQNASSYTWLFGDGNTSPSTNPTHPYQNGGTYTVTLIGTSNTFGCVDSITNTVFINSLPNIQVSLNDTVGCRPLQVNFTNNSTNSNFFTWDFKDGNTSSFVSPNHTFDTVGVFNVGLIVENSAGCFDSIKIPVTIYPKPTASFILNPNFSCNVPVNVSPNNNSVGATNYVWNFGNGTPLSFLTNPTTTYNNFGKDTIVLIASNSYGCSDTATNIFYATLPPQISINPDTAAGCKPFVVSFTNNTSDATNYIWYFGTGDSTTNVNPTYTYLNDGVYNITLFASNQFCSTTETIQNSITVYPKPTSDFTFSQLYVDGKANGTIQFTNACQNSLNFLWNFDDGDTSTAYSPSHQFQSLGNYFVSLVSFNEYGCTDTSTKVVVPDYFAALHIPNAFMPNNPAGGDSRLFLPKGKSITSYELQIFNTWGVKIFESTKLDENGSPAEGWDGTFNGVLCQQDVYVWKITAIFSGGKTWEGIEQSNGKYKNTGTVTLLK
ncbi:MAG: PKD domain-containing protein [Bacteroidota bacterium]